MNHRNIGSARITRKEPFSRGRKLTLTTNFDSLATHRTSSKPTFAKEEEKEKQKNEQSENEQGGKDPDHSRFSFPGYEGLMKFFLYSYIYIRGYLGVSSGKLSTASLFNSPDTMLAESLTI